MTRLAPGEVLGGKYVVTRLLGDGGSAEVYEAEHTVMGHRVAVKVMRPREEGAAHLLDRFEREMRISALLRHRHLLEVFDVGVRDDGSPFLVMELLHGTDLQHSIDNGIVGVSDVVEVGCQLLAALSALAGRGVVHRDVKPQNIMICEDDGETVVKLVDFGIAQCPDKDDITGRLTREGLLVGTPHYMAPEQVLGRPLDCRADVYGAGAVLYEALTGCPPFDGETTTEIVAAILRDHIMPIRTLRPDCPEELEHIVMRALSREREARWRHPRHMREALLAIWQTLEPEDRDARPERPGSVFPPPVTLGEPAAIPPTADAGVGRPPGPDDESGPPERWRPRPPRRVVAGGLAVGVVAFVAWAWIGLTPVTPASGAATSSLPETRSPAGTAAEPPGPAPAPAGEEPGDADAIVPTDCAPPTARELEQRALAAYARGERAGSEDLYRRSLACDPEHAAAWRGLGLVADELGEPDEARRALRRYLRLAPGAPDEQRIHARLRRLASERAAPSSYAALPP